MRQLAGGRVTARVETTSSPEGTASVVQAVLEQVDDRYLIADETVVDAAAATPAAAGEEQAAAGGGAGEAVTVESYDIYFEPSELSIPADTDVTVSLPNEGVTLHNFSIDELGINVDIAARGHRGDGHQCPGRHLRVLLQRAGAQARRHGWHPDRPIALAAGRSAQSS